MFTYKKKTCETESPKANMALIGGNISRSVQLISCYTQKPDMVSVINNIRLLENIDVF